MSREHPWQRADDGAVEHRGRVYRGWVRARAAWFRWGQLALGLWLIVVSVVLLLVGIATYANKDVTERAADQSCSRARTYGPYVADDYERRHVMPKALIDGYRSSIPRHCPND